MSENTHTKARYKIPDAQEREVCRTYQGIMEQVDKPGEPREVFMYWVGVRDGYRSMMGQWGWSFFLTPQGYCLAALTDEEMAAFVAWDEAALT